MLLYFVNWLKFVLLLQGPLGWQSLAEMPTGEFPLRDIDYFVNADEHAEISAMSWETAIQKHVEEELSASSIEVVEIFLPYHLINIYILHF